MKILLQRVTSASVSVDGGEVGRIGAGLVVFIGIANGDTEEDIRYIVPKMLGLRIFENAEGKFDLSVTDIKGGLLIVSQFTLLADARKGRRPSFTDAAPPAQAEALCNKFVELARSSGLQIATGRFQQYMQVEIHNDGPVTIMLDSREKFKNAVHPEPVEG